MLRSRRPISSRSLRPFTLLLFLVASTGGPAPAVAGATGPVPAELVPASAAGSPAEAETEALQEAIWRFERRLRRSLAAADGPVPAGAVPDSEGMRRRLEHLRSAARRTGDGELERKVRALRPLLVDLARHADPGATRRSPSPWRPQAALRIAPLAAASHASCAGALAAGDGAWHAGLGEPGAPGEVWWRYTATADGWASVTTAGSDLDTVVEVFAACPPAGGAPLVRGDDEIGLQARADFRVAAGESRWIRVAGWRGAAGSAVIALGGPGVPGGISGTVTAEATGAPVTFQDVHVWDQNGFFAASTVTSELGVYAVSGLTPGTYFVSSSVFALELLDELYDDVPCPGGVFNGGCDPTDGTPVTVLSGSVTSGIDLALGPGATVAGRVRESGTGVAVPFADVVVFDTGGFGIGFETADVAGRYRISGFADQTVFVRAVANDHAAELYDDLPCEPCDPTTGTPVPLTIGTVTGGIDFSLDAKGAIEGRLTAAGGTPIAFEEVTVYDAAGNFHGSEFTDSAGDYRRSGLAPGQYFVATTTFDYLDELYDDLPCEPFCDPTAGTPVTVAVGTTATGIDFELVELGRIAGQVVDSVTGLPVPSVDVQVWDSTGAFVTSDFVSSGLYDVGGLADGDYFLTAVSFFAHAPELYEELPCPGGGPPQCDPTSGTPVAVQVGATTPGIDFTLDRLGSISGTVTLAGSGMPLGSISVRAWNGSGVAVAFDSTDSLGRYVLDELPVGAYTVTATTPLYVSELYDDLPCPGGPPAGCDPTTGTPVAVGVGGMVDGIDFALAPKGSIEGSVTEQGSGLPLGFADVAVFNAAGSFVTGVGADGMGQYRVPGLETGTYFVTASRFGHAPELYDDLPCPPATCDPTDGTPVAVTFGSATPGIGFSLERLGGIRGRVTESGTGAPVPSARLWLFDDLGILRDSVFATFPDGDYSFSEVFAGTWFVVATDLPDHADELYDDLPCPDLTCDPTTGTPIPVSNGSETTGIDFALDVASGIVGRVTGDLGETLAGVAVDLWNPAGELFASTATGVHGFYRLAPGAGTWFVSTDNGQGLLDELYDDVACPLGPAFEGLCDPLDGDPVVLATSQSLADEVDFQLTGSPLIFADGFESGDTTAWSATAP